MDDAASIAKRLLDGDTSLWPQPNVAASRLGWLHTAERLAGEAAALATWANSVERSHVVLVGL